MCDSDAWCRSINTRSCAPLLLTRDQQLTLALLCTTRLLVRLQLADEHFIALVHKFDPNGDGSISYDEVGSVAYSSCCHGCIFVYALIACDWCVFLPRRAHPLFRASSSAPSFISVADRSCCSGPLLSVPLPIPLQFNRQLGPIIHPDAIDTSKSFTQMMKKGHAQVSCTSIIQRLTSRGFWWMAAIVAKAADYLR